MKQEHSVEFSKAISQLTLRDIFFTALFYNLKVERDDELEMAPGIPGVACTDGARLIYRADTFASNFTDKLRVSVLAHEILHVIMFHPLRRGARDAMAVTPDGTKISIWNLACDHVVNLLLKEHAFDVAPDWLCDGQYTGMTAEQVYDKIVEQCKKNGSAKMPSPGGIGGDVMDYDPAAPGSDGVSKADLERAIGIGTEKALQAAKAAGKNSAALKRMIGDAQVVREPWYQHLRRYMNSMHARQYNWNRINARRAVAFGIVSPDMRTETMGKIAVGVDCSGSITLEQLSAMGAHLSDIARECNPKSVKVMYFDSEVCFEEEFEGPEYAIKLSPHGGGGTCFEPVLARTEEDGEAQVLLMFTDMFGSFGDGYAGDMLWVTPTTNVEPPFGEVIHADFND